MEKKTEGSNYYIYFAVFAVNIISFSANGCWSWASPVLPKLHSTDPNVNPLAKPTTMLEDSWIVSIVNLGAIVGTLAGGVFSQKLGKKTGLLILAAPIVVSHILCAVAVNVHYFLIARFLIGVGAGSCFPIIPGFITEIAEVKSRGAFGTLFGVFGVSGVLFMFLTGSFMSVRWFSWMNVLFPILFYLIFGLFILDTPYDLIRLGKEEQARQSLMKLRGKTGLEIKKEIQYIIDSNNSQAQAAESVSLITLFKSRPLRRALIICNAVLFFQQFSGINAVTAYMQTIFDATGSTIPSAYSAIIIGSVQLVGNLFCSQLVERTGRRILLIVSCFFSMLSLVTLGIYFFLKESGIQNISSINWLPIVSLVVFTFSFNIGLANIPWIITAELFPTHMKALSSTMTSLTAFVSSFLITLYFPMVSEVLGMPATYWIFASLLFFGLVFTFLFVPETKGKSKEDIHTMLEKGVKQ